MSAEAESLIERCLVYDDTMQAMRATLAEMEKGNVDAALWRLGYRPRREMIDGKAHAHFVVGNHRRNASLATSWHERRLQHSRI